MNLAHFAARLYANGHVPADFREGGALKPGMVIVSPLRPPQVSVGGLHVPEKAREVAGQFALAHVVEAIGPVPAFVPNLLPLRIGDVVKTREAHLDPLDHRGNLCSVPHEHVLRVFGNALDGDSVEVEPNTQAVS
jgi:hypothetical protein